MKMLRCRQIVFVCLTGFFFPFACAEKKAEEVVAPEQPLTDLPVAPAAPVAPEAPVTMEIDERAPSEPVAKKKKPKAKPAGKTQNKRVRK
jgi:hypothetical protein